MRRSVGIALLALGVLALVLAPLLRWYAYPRLAVVADAERELISQGSDVTVLDPALVQAGGAEFTRIVDVTSMRTIQPDPDAGDDDTAVWDLTAETTDGSGVPLAATSERVAFDRRSGEAVAGFGQYVSPTGREEDRVDTDHAGWVVKLPFGVEDAAYPWWDPVLGETRPAEFEDDGEIDGLAVRRFVQTIEPVAIAQVDVPGRLFGSAEALVVADRMYAVTRTLWVEPRTGAVVRAQEDLDVHFALAGQRGPSILQGMISYDDETVAANVEEFGGRSAVLDLVGGRGPVWGAIGGAVAVVAGVVLLGRVRLPASYAPRRAAARGIPGIADGAGRGSRRRRDGSTDQSDDRGDDLGRGPGDDPAGDPGVDVEGDQPFRELRGPET